VLFGSPTIFATSKTNFFTRIFCARRDESGATREGCVMGVKEEAWAAAMLAERRGDDAAYEWLLSDVARALRVIVQRRASRLGIPPHDVEDIVQETLIGLHMMRRRWQEERPLLPWLHAIVRYKLTDAVRRRTREHRYRGELSYEEWEDITDGHDHGDAFQTGHDMDQALAVLPAAQRDVVEAVALEGESIRGVASRLGTSEGAIRMTMHRALKKLAAWAGQPDGEEGKEQ
jgi:RNA polymerase sigma-70 factor, ECF subfamily